MRYAALIALLLAVASCSKNRESEDRGSAGSARVGDTTRMHDSSRIHDDDDSEGYDRAQRHVAPHPGQHA